MRWRPAGERWRPTGTVRGAVMAGRDRQGCGDSEQGSSGGMCRPAGVVKGAVAADRGRQGCGGGQQLCAAASKVMNDHYYCT